MRRILLPFFCMCFLALNAFSQCTPDTNITHNVIGMYPDSATGLPHAVVGVPYSTVVQLKVLTDTTFDFGGGPIYALLDYIDIFNVTGLPPGFTYTCTPSNCRFLAGADACILLQCPAGPLLASIGTHPISVQVIAQGFLGGAGGTPVAYPYSLNRYSIVVDQNSSIASLNMNKFDAGQNFPNPFSGFSEIPFSSPVPSLVTIKITNLLGKVVYSESLFAKSGLNRIPLSSKNFVPGIYIYTISSSKVSYTRRMIVAND